MIQSVSYLTCKITWKVKSYIQCDLYNMIQSVSYLTCKITWRVKSYIQCDLYNMIQFPIFHVILHGEYVHVHVQHACTVGHENCFTASMTPLVSGGD